MEGDWYDNEGEARINEDHDTIDVEGLFWLKSVSEEKFITDYMEAHFKSKNKL